MPPFITKLLLLIVGILCGVALTTFINRLSDSWDLSQLSSMSHESEMTAARRQLLSGHSLPPVLPPKTVVKTRTVVKSQEVATGGSKRTAAKAREARPQSSSSSLPGESGGNGTGKPKADSRAPAAPLQKKLSVNTTETQYTFMSLAEWSQKLPSESQMPPHVSGGPVWSADAPSSYPWADAERKLLVLPTRRKGLQETIWAGRRTKPCGKVCVAHCIAGQPRDMIHNKGLWKSYRHRLFDKFSDDPVVFVMFSATEWKGGGAGDGYAAYVRTQAEAASDKALLKSFEAMSVDRALIIREPCKTGDCLQKGAGLSCLAKPLRLTAQYDRRTKNVSNFCDVQVRRFQTCMHLVREYEEDHDVKFSWVARDRPDVYFAEPSARYTKLRTDTVYLKPWAACGFGGMDWFYVMPRQQADIVARFPDDMRCDYLMHPKVQPVCKDCIGCECFLAAWMYAQKVKFQPVPPPWDGFIPLKFCGGGCPPDWAVNEKNICRGFCQGRDKMPDVKM